MLAELRNFLEHAAPLAWDDSLINTYYQYLLLIPTINTYYQYLQLIPTRYY